MSKSVVSALEQLAKDKPDKPAYIFYDKHWKRTVISRQEMWELSGRFASILHKRGIGRGHVVSNTLPNSPERLITQMGTMMAGAIDMNGQICLADGKDFLYSMNQGKARAVILDPSNEKGAAKLLQPRLNVDIQVGGQVSCLDIPSLQLVIPCSFQESSQHMSTLMEEIIKEPQQAMTSIQPTETCTYLCTSGSTGFFKLILLNSEMVLNLGQIFGGCFEIEANKHSVYFCDRPLGWGGGYPSIFLAHGCTVVCIDTAHGLPENYAEFVWEILNREKCTAVFSKPLLLESLSETVERPTHNTGYMVEVFGIGGGPVSKNHMKAIGKVTKSVLVVYGCTEGGIITQWKVSNPDNYDNCAVGWPTTGTEIQVVDTNLQELPPGQEGEIILKSIQSAAQYVNDDRNTKKTFLPDGWIRLGDVGIRNNNGLLYVLGRRHFAILRGPSVVYPYQLEMKIVECPGVSDIVIVGVPDEHNFEEMCALIITKPETNITVNTIQEFCKNKLFLENANTDLSPVPKYFLFVDDFPTTDSGKVNRFEAKSMACKLLNLKQRE